MEHMGNNGKQVYNTKYYNFDMIISIDFRVNSKKAIKFRAWTNNTINVDWFFLAVRGKIVCYNAERCICDLLSDKDNQDIKNIKYIITEYLNNKKKRFIKIYEIYQKV